MATLVSIRQKCIFNRFERFWPFNILGFATNRFLRRVFQSLFGLLAVAVRRLGPLFGIIFRLCPGCYLLRLRVGLGRNMDF